MIRVTFAESRSPHWIVRDDQGRLYEVLIRDVHASNSAYYIWEAQAQRI